eukprot:m.45563 g.45563  ORF g.45563 m.45563 type:complete len:384 (+) comp10265_c0_seq1:172-1323(+)
MDKEKEKPNSPPRLLIILGMFSIQVTNVGYNVVAKLAVGNRGKEGGVNPLVFSFLRDSLAFPLLMIMAIIWDGFRLPRLADVPRIFLLGLTGMFGNQFLFILGLTMETQFVATVTTRFQPVFGSLIAMFIGLERFLWMKVLAVALAVGGALILTIDDILKGAKGVTGILVLLAGALSMSFFYVLQKPIVKKYRPVSITAWSYFSGAASMGLAALYYAPWTREWEIKICKEGIDQHQIAANHTEPGCSMAMWRLDKISWIAVAVAVILNSVLKYILITICNKHATVTEIMMWGTLVVPLGAVADLVILHKQLHPLWAYVGILPIFMGLGLIHYVNTSKKEDVRQILSWQRPLLTLLCGEDAVPKSSLNKGVNSYTHTTIISNCF